MYTNYNMGSIKSILLIFFILFVHLGYATSSSSNSRCMESERKALLEFKGSLVNDSNSLSSWTGRNCCSWHGITCHNLTRHVEVLNLGGYGTQYYFNSSLSPWLFNLTRLKVLVISSSGLHGPIPNMFEKLIGLTTLDFSYNSFGSSLPNSMCSLASLTYMDLTMSQIQGSIPSCLRNLTSLTELWLGNNKLSGEIPGELGFLTHLNSLDLDDNQLSGSIPSTFGNLTQLQYLDVSSNSLMLELSESFLEGFKSLKSLYISGNRYLAFNVSPQWIPPFQIQEIIMDSVFIGTQFPPWLQTQINLGRLSMSNASISGAIPNWCLASLPNVRQLDLSYNILTGSMPTPNSTNTLVELELSTNQLGGNIPKELCNLQYLKILSLANNLLKGRIPSCLGALRKLVVLDLGNNSLSGHIPNELGSFLDLDVLHLNENKLFGELPVSLQNLTSLTTLDLGENQLSGSIPQLIGKNLSSLQYLRLESNYFSGEIPVNLCQLPSLHILNLAINNLSGTIPSCFGSLSKMLSDESSSSCNSDYYNEALLNIIKGREMEYTSSLPCAKFISLSSNHLYGDIPSELMNLSGLQSLNLSNNELTGMIPETINKLKNLESLDLSMNRLSGNIPQSLTNIDTLGYLNLSFNNLEGKVPSGNHFNTLDDPSIYEGNVELCGKLLMKSCPGDESPTSNQPNGLVSDTGDDFHQLSWLYAGIGPGFTVGFLGVICILYFKDSWRIAYFGFADNVYNKVWVTSTIKISQFRSKFN